MTKTPSSDLSLSVQRCVSRCRTWLVATLVLPLACSAQEKICINEIMYHPVEEPAFGSDGQPVLDLTEDLHEFVELHNYGTNTVALGGWELTGGIQYAFPPGAQLLPEEHLVVAKAPALLAAVKPYALTEASLYGPWQGNLSNNGETLRLRNARGEIVDLVSYSAAFPWPISADAMGASERFTGLAHTNYQYRGRSLERVASGWAGNDPANWLASPLSGEPSPGKPNAVRLSQPLPVVTSLAVYQQVDEQPILRQNQPVRIDAAFSSGAQLGRVRIEYFVDNVNLSTDPTTVLWMTAVGGSDRPQFTVSLPGQADRSVVRYRLWAERGGSLGLVSPREDDPFAWHAYYVSPVRPAGTVAYDLFISDAGVSRLRANITQSPPRVTTPDPPGFPRENWNATEPAVFACDGVVRDVHVRHHRSRYNIKTTTYKIFFPRYNRFNDQDTMLETDKGYDNVAGYGVFRAAGLPAPHTRTVNLYVNANGAMSRLEIEDYDEELLKKYHRTQHLLNPDLPEEKVGELYKSTGYIPAVVPREGPYGPGDASLLPAIPPWWTPRQRYEWTYPLQNHDWKGEYYFQQMLEGLWAARGDSSSNPKPNIAATRKYLEEHFDVDKMLTYIAVLNWMGPWDDSTQNHFLWQQANGKWCMLPWDLDALMAGDKVSNSIYNGEVNDPSNNFRGPNYIKDSFIKAFRPELKERFHLLIHTLLHPDSIAAMGYSSYRSFATSRNANVLQQIGLGEFQRPGQPVHAFPADGSSALPPDLLRASVYTHSATPAPAHASTTWEIRASDGTWSAPVLRRTSSTNLTSLPIPFEQLEFGRTYFWRCTYTDANGHPSLASAPTTFTFGGSTSGTQTNVTVLAAVDGTTSWRYHRTADYPGDAWATSGFDDSTWLQGPALLGHAKAGSLLPEPVRTEFTNYTSAVTTYYFRLKFPFHGNPQAATLQLSYIIDDGAAFYLNGKKLWSARLPDAVDPSTFADQMDVATLEGPVTLSGGDLVEGENLLAVEVHQSNANSGDVIFGASLSALTTSSTGADVVLNEILADNANALGTGDIHSDWVELYNGSDKAIPLAGWVLTDDVLKPSRFTFPTNATLAARGFLTVWCDDATNDPGYHTGFALDKDGQTVVLMAPATNGFVVKDLVTFGLQIPNLSVGRVMDGSGDWQLAIPTFGDRNQAQLTTNVTELKLNEWMASPLDGDDWFEVFNPLPLPASLGGCFLSDSATAPGSVAIPPLSFIAAHGFARFIADGQPEKGANHVDFKLSAGGETIALFSSGSVPKSIDTVTFSAQQTGVSEGRLPDGQTQLARFPVSPTPAAPNYLPLTNVVINEVLTHSHPPFDDAVELHNPTAANVAVGGWYLSDSPFEPKKYLVPAGWTLPPAGYGVLYESQFNADTNSPTSFAFDADNGDTVVLSAADAEGNLTGYRAYLEFGPLEQGAAFGRVPTSIGYDYAPLSGPSFGVDVPATPEEWHQGTGAANLPARVGPAVISEIMYRPPDFLVATNLVDNTEHEFVEIANHQTTGLPLFLVDTPAQTWRLRGAVDFDFPTNILLAPYGTVVVVGFDPATNQAALASFSGRYDVSPGSLIVGPWKGQLGNRSESVRLLRPIGAEVGNDVPYTLVERVDYASEAPWPSGASGTGSSIHRIDARSYGNDPAHWKAALASPGRVETPLRIESISAQGGEVTFRFVAKAAQSYRVEFCDDLRLAAWQLAEEVPAGQTERMVAITKLPPTDTPARFYRLRMP